MAKILILYYSRTGENYVNGKIQSLEKGNTQICAEYIQKAVGGDLFRIETAAEYPTDYYACTEIAKEELQRKARPELKKALDSIDDYTHVFVCGPCWWGTFPTAVFTQLEMLNWKGKKVMALMTHEGSGLGLSEKDLKKTCSGASFGKGLAVQGAQAQESESRVAAWAKKQV